MMGLVLPKMLIKKAIYQQTFINKKTFIFTNHKKNDVQQNKYQWCTYAFAYGIHQSHDQQAFVSF
jgi:predicted component of type VI protein secretion system